MARWAGLLSDTQPANDSDAPFRDALECALRLAVQHYDRAELALSTRDHYALQTARLEARMHDIYEALTKLRELRVV